MATITDYQAAKFRQELHKKVYDELLAISPPLTKAQLKAAFQACEDFWENSRAGLKADIDTAVGQALSVSLAKKIGKLWLKWKWGIE